MVTIIKHLRYYSKKLLISIGGLLLLFKIKSVVIEGNSLCYFNCRNLVNGNISKEISHKIYGARLANLQTFCKNATWEHSQLGQWTNQASFWKDKLWLSKEYKFSYCHIPKVGSSTWYRHLLTLAGSLAVRDDAKYSNEYDPYKVRTMIRRSFYNWPQDMHLELSSRLLNFVFTRHPFSRLVSGFNEKMKISWKFNPEMAKLRKDILFKYRKITEKHPEFDTTNPSPLEFCQYLLDYTAENGVLSLNGHFRPQWSLCPFCLIDFDVIGRLEDFDEDSQFIMDILGIRDILDPSIHERMSRTANQKRTNLEFFSDVPRPIIEKLYQLYKMDFEAFGYHPEEFYDMANEQRFRHTEKREKLGLDYKHTHLD